MAEPQHSLTSRWQVIIILVSFSLLVITGGLFFFKMQINKILNEKERELNSVINLKVSDIVDWRKEHVRDARILGESPGVTNLMTNFLEGNVEESTLRNIFLPMLKDYDYQSILIADNDNVVRFSTAGTMNEEISYEAPESGSPDLHLSTDSSFIFMDIPFRFNDLKGNPAGTLILRVDPELTLFRNIQTWPTQSKTSETLVFRKEGDSLLYLNELRHRQGTAMKLKLSARDSLLPAARAVSGVEGFFQGRDYRGTKVVSYLKKIPDSPWYMVAKTDKSEIYAPLYEQFILILLLVSLTIISFSIILRLYFRNQSIKYLNELNRTRDKLYSIISHDLKNPFVSIMGFSELLYERSLKSDFSKTGEYASMIYTSSRNAMDLLHNLTGWTKLQTGRTLYNPKELNLVALIHEVIEFCHPTALMKAVKIDIQVPRELNVIADKEMIGTILRNLIHNAIKFSYKGSEISIKAEQNRDMIVLEVKDSGIGMDKHTIDKLVNHSPVESTPGTANEKGTGLGIYICKEFVSFHNGSLHISSEPGKGTSFKITFPEMVN